MTKLKTTKKTQILFYPDNDQRYAPAGTKVSKVLEVRKEDDGDRLLVSFEGFKGSTWVQCDFGHVARKATWLYFVGVHSIGPLPPAREPTHWISGGRGREGKKAKTTPVPPGIKVCSEVQRRRTPIAFAQWLISLAEQANDRSLTQRRSSHG